MFKHILCWWGLHDWAYVTPSRRHRVCCNCSHREELWDYSSHSQKWEDLKEGQDFHDFDKEREERKRILKG